jgi:ABC-type nitrate/sulfonate/bicarbonate transport system substrate-binding protein
VKSFTLLPLFLLFAGCPSPEPVPTAPPPPETATPSETVSVGLVLNGAPSEMHAGYYHGLAKDWFQHIGIDLVIWHGKGDRPPIPEDATFVVVDADVLLQEREQGNRLVAIFAPFQINPTCVAVRRDSNISNLAQLREITLYGDADGLPIRFLRSTYGLDGVKFADPTADFAAMLGDPKAAAVANVLRDPLTFKRNNISIRVLPLSAAEFNLYPAVLAAHEDLLNKDPELVRQMVKAAMRSWLGYLAKPEVANTRLMTENEALDADFLAFAGQQSAKLILAGEAEDGILGMMSVNRWAKIQEQLVALKLVQGGEPVTAAFSTRFLR